ncbi:hypothetical protein GZH46_01451 [Fragariocoptes setiger]|uniref:Uncharacterized protein n=1 Tax=Fragariocoptes setiger TaxID=1670756 RepID=A0ABQ7S9I8_9ACAR|nr:hypothetical protein GZH46_01451 [Fragariocoptes setiger]
MSFLSQKCRRILTSMHLLSVGQHCRPRLISSSGARCVKVEHLNQDKPVIRIPYYYNESMQTIRQNINQEEKELLTKIQLQGRKDVSVIRCKSIKLAHFQGQRYKPGRVPLASYRWASVKSAGQDFKVRAFSMFDKKRNAHLKEPGLLSGHVEQRFMRVARHARPNLLVEVLNAKLDPSKPKDGPSDNDELTESKEHPSSKPAFFVLIYCRKMSTAAFLEHHLRSQGFSSRFLKSSLSESSQIYHLQEMLSTGCRIIIRTNDFNPTLTHLESCPIQHMIHYDCPGSVDHYENLLESLFYGDVTKDSKPKGRNEPIQPSVMDHNSSHPAGRIICFFLHSAFKMSASS